MELNTENSNTLCVLLFMCIIMAAFGLITMHNGGISFDRMRNEMNTKYNEGLKVVAGDGKYQGVYWIELNGEIIHGGFNRIQAAEGQIATYQKIYDAGVRKGILQK